MPNNNNVMETTKPNLGKADILQQIGDSEIWRLIVLGTIMQIGHLVNKDETSNLTTKSVGSRIEFESTDVVEGSLT